MENTTLHPKDANPPIGRLAVNERRFLYKREDGSILPITLSNHVWRTNGGIHDHWQVKGTLKTLSHSTVDRAIKAGIFIPVAEITLTDLMMAD